MIPIRLEPFRGSYAVGQIIEHENWPKGLTTMPQREDMIESHNGTRVRVKEIIHSTTQINWYEENPVITLVVENT